MKWPRGKWNGRPIVGLWVKGRILLCYWQWLPQFEWFFGEPSVHWLVFQVRAGVEYR